MALGAAQGGVAEGVRDLATSGLTRIKDNGRFPAWFPSCDTRRPRVADVAERERARRDRWIRRIAITGIIVMFVVPLLLTWLFPHK